MSLSVKTTRLDGDVSVGRNISAGGKVEIAGSVNVGHNVLVGGWLDAPNIKGPLKGLFATEAALKAAYPHPRPGWVAYVGDNLPAAIYMAVGGKWVATGKHGGEPSLSADSLYDIVEGVRQDVLGLEANVAENREGLSDARAALDTLRTDTDSLRQETTSLGGRLGDVEETVRRNIGRSVDVTELDTRFTADADTVLDVARGELAGSWNVTIRNGGNVRTIGVLHVWSDDALHTVTQEFTTNALLNKSGNFECVHDHGVHSYTRYYTVKYADTLPDGTVIPAKTWSSWTDRDAALDTLREETVSLGGRLNGIEETVRKNIGRSVDVTELDTRFTADADTVLDVARGELSGSWNVTIRNGGNVRTIGVLHVWADDALHTVTQEFTTNALLNKSGNFECVHDHGVHCYTRYYTVKYADTLPDGSVLPAKTWSGWTDRDSALDRLRQEMEERADSLDERLSDIEFNIGAGHSYESLLARLVRLEKGLEGITRLLTLS